MKPLVLPDIEAYAEAHSEPESDICRVLREETERTMECPQMVVGPLEGAFLKMMARLVRARRVLEIGTFTGYSALAMALALPPAGRIVCCDLNEEWISIARKFWGLALVSKKIQVRIGPALETLRTLKGPFDLAFIDADKENYARYYERCLALVRRGGLIAADNTLWYGRVIDPRDRSVDTRAIRAFNARLHRDRRVDVSLVPIGDGLTLARRR